MRPAILGALAAVAALLAPVLNAVEILDGHHAQDVRFADATAADLIRKSRAAIGGGRPIADIRALRMTGRLRIPAEGAPPSDGAIDIRIQLPDRYVRVETIGRIERWSGFDRSTLLTATRDAGRLTPPRRSERAALMGEARELLTWLLLGVAAIGDQSLTLRATDDEAFPDTKSLDVTQGRSDARLVVDAQSAVPLRVVYWAGKRGNTVTSFSDRRAVAGFLLPHRITTTTPTHVLETLMLDEIVVNPVFTDADFRQPQ